MSKVELADLETIRRFSIATRGSTAPLEDVVAALRADLEALTSGERSAPATPEPTVAARKASTTRKKAATRPASGKRPGRGS